MIRIELLWQSVLFKLSRCKLLQRKGFYFKDDFFFKNLERIIKQNVLAANRQCKNNICRGLDGEAMAIHVITRVTTKTLTVAEQEKLDTKDVFESLG